MLQFSEANSVDTPPNEANEVAFERKNKDELNDGLNLH
jgi:hypothetical protein